MPYFCNFGLEFEKNCCHIWNQHSQTALIAKYREIIKMPKCGTKNALVGYFGAKTLKCYCHIWNQHLRISVTAKFCKKKCLNLGSKMPYMGIFDPKCLIWVFLGKKLRKTIVIFEISSLKSFPLQNFTKKQKCLNLAPKISDLGIFGLEF